MAFAGSIPLERFCTEPVVVSNSLPPQTLFEVLRSKKHAPGVTVGVGVCASAIAAKIWSAAIGKVVMSQRDDTLACNRVGLIGPILYYTSEEEDSTCAATGAIWLFGSMCAQHAVPPPPGLNGRPTSGAG